MTAKELADELKIKESYLKSHWQRICESNLKNGTILIKVGRGASADYGIRFLGDNEVRWESSKHE